MGKSVDWLDVYARYGAEDVCRGMFVFARPGVVLALAEKAKQVKGARSEGAAGGPAGAGGPSDEAGGDRGGSDSGGGGDAASAGRGWDDEDFVQPGSDDELIGWGGGSLTMKEAIERDVFIRASRGHPAYMARKVMVRKFLPPPPPPSPAPTLSTRPASPAPLNGNVRSGSTFSIARHQQRWWLLPRRPSSLPQWKPVEDELLEAAITEELCGYWRAAPVKGDDYRIKPLVTVSSKALTENTLRSMVGYTHIDKEISMPCWIPPGFDEHGKPTWTIRGGIEDETQEEWSPYKTLGGRPILAHDLIATRDGLLDVDAFSDESLTEDSVKGWRERFRLLPHTPRYFNNVVLPHRVDVEGIIRAHEDGEIDAYFKQRCPSWMAYIADCAAGDELWPDLAQEILAALIHIDHKRQVLPWLQGPPGSGKTTFIEGGVRAVVGKSVTKCTAQSLTRPFALTALLRRKVYWIDELRLDRTISTAALLDLILSHVGGGTSLVEEKHRSASEMVDVRLPGMFVVCCNNDPNWRDAEAIIRRLLVLPFVPMEKPPDNGLWDRLNREAEAIFMWALFGVPRLRARGFTKLPRGEALLEQIHRRVSVVHAFVRDCCVIGEGNAVETNLLREVFYQWCRDGGDDRAEDFYTAERFGTELCARRGVKREEGVRRPSTSPQTWSIMQPCATRPYRCYLGIRPLRDGETAEGAQAAATIVNWDHGVGKPQTTSKGEELPYAT